MPSHRFTDDDSHLVFSHAVGAILLDSAGRYLLQHRDDKPGIWFPDHWGFFGGALEAGEEPRAGLARELAEELGLVVDPARAAFVMRQAFDLGGLGIGLRWRHVFALTLGEAEREGLVLAEGAGMRWIDGGEALTALRLAPYDGFALFLHRARGRIV